MINKLILAAAAFISALGLAYYWLFLSVGTASPFAIDIDDIRLQAQSMVGERAQSIRVEEVAMMETPGSAIVVGDPLGENKPIATYAYQVVFADYTLIIDTAFPPGIAEDLGTTAYNEDAYQRVLAAMNKATTIVATHEHSDHIGGLFYHPNIDDIKHKTILTKDQLEEPAPYAGLDFSRHPLHDHQFEDFETFHPLAPGVVLIKAPGHTPGSLMIYVQLKNRAEYLFVGDIAWHHRNIDVGKSRSRIASQLILREDHGKVLGQVKWLHQLLANEKNLNIIPGHDLFAVEALKSKNLLIDQFKLAD